MKFIKPIHDKSEYKSALKRIDELVLSNPKKGSVAYEELDILGTLVSSYEAIHFPIGDPQSN